MKILSEILSSKSRAAILRLLFDGSERELHVREIQRRSGFSVRTVRDELERLLKLDLIQRREDGNRVCYRAKTEHPLYSELVRIVIKTAGLADILRDALVSQDISIAFVFGSVASGEELATSDVDLMIIGDITLREAASVLGGAGAKVGREINPFVITAAEFRERLRSDDHFVGRVMAGSKIFVVGTQDDLEALA
jgi:predicted nucleotidyltransferase/predicted DNA-binding transcriptional regulator